MPESVSQITDIPKGRDTPPHLVDDSIFDQPKLEIPLELAPISGPIYDGDAPETLRKDFILLMSFLVFTLHRIVISYKQRLGLPDPLSEDTITCAEESSG